MTSTEPTMAENDLGMPKMPIQQWTNISDLHSGLKAGTIFPDLDKPFHMGGVTLGG